MGDAHVDDAGDPRLSSRVEQGPRVGHGLVVIGVGILALGAFPPDPRTQTIQKVLPNDRFKTN